MSWTVDIVRERNLYTPGPPGTPAFQKVKCDPLLCLSLDGDCLLDADNLRILIDALHCALDILKPDWAPTPKEME